ncbi:MAG TPA: protein translocase subunit SecD [Candidatus Pacearchaeota archaeon]|nr:protein translocase subunit SecD [Candidatus Pacearchaeota archaeon]HOK94402.1 protein translocase subunit SecD [Candidatus Pacearchaeota archaeon]HPO75475.1 protein translocase subunit SecD [Candidatus Pacearchaeota archaeon]
MSSQKKNWILSIFVLLLAIFLAFFVMPGRVAKKFNIELPQFLQRPYKLGLDLRGGVHLLYEADLSQVPKEDWQDSMEGLRDVIERRVNLFGIQEPLVQIQKTGESYRLIVELAGIDDPTQAIEMIGKTPYLEFREEMTEEEKQEIINMLSEEEINNLIEQIKEQTGKDVKKEELAQYLPLYKSTELTGKYLKSAKIEFNQTTYEPIVSLEFNSEGAKLFEEITERNIGKSLAIYIDNQLISAPMVKEKISGGKAQITGKFTVEEARNLAQNLNAGALPVPIKLISQQRVGPSLGEASIDASVKAGVIGFLLVILFMILVYKLSGVLASLALFFYGVILLSLFKIIPVTLTLSGIAGFVLSLGMAVDANVLIFERLREELKVKQNSNNPVQSNNQKKNEKNEGLREIDIDNSFSRAWPAIRDGNLTTLIICAILFLIASGFVQGFALTLSLGVLISMFTAMTITKLFMKTFSGTRLSKNPKIWIR